MDNDMFLGFSGQGTALAFEVGRFRDIGENYHVYDTERNVAHKSDYTVGTRRIVLRVKDEPAALLDHIDRMRTHLISQFQWEPGSTKEKRVLKAEIEALGEKLNELRDVFLALRNNRWIETGIGNQLDGIGQIVDRSREIGQAIAIKFFGFYDQPNTGTFDEARFREADEDNLESYRLNDTEYRAVLKQKVINNSSRATTEDMIRSLKYIFDAPQIMINEIGNANVVVAIGRKLTDNQIMLARATDLVVKPAGVGLYYRVHYNANDYFGFNGQPYARGFEDGRFVDIF